MTTEALKKEQRKYVKGLIANTSLESLASQSESVCEKVISMPIFLSCHTILAYMALPRECDPKNIVTAANKLGMHVAFPLCNPDHTLTICLPNDDNAFIVGAYGITEPDISRSTVLSPKELDLIIVPGIAFDKNCMRLGRGAGFYDRLLATSSAYTLGIAFDEQILDEVATDTFDLPVNAVVTKTHTFMRE